MGGSGSGSRWAPVHPDTRLAAWIEVGSLLLFPLVRERLLSWTVLPSQKLSRKRQREMPKFDLPVCPP